MWLLCSHHEADDIISAVRSEFKRPILLTVDVGAGGPAFLVRFLSVLGVVSDIALVEADLEHLLSEIADRSDTDLVAEDSGRAVWLNLVWVKNSEEAILRSTVAAIRLVGTLIANVARLVVIDSISGSEGKLAQTILDDHIEKSSKWIFIDLEDMDESSAVADFFKEAELDSAPVGANELPLALLVLIAHPDGKRLGSRFVLPPGSMVVIGRSVAAGICLLEVLSVSRWHAKLHYHVETSVVTLEDLGSTNGTMINGELFNDVAVLKTGDVVALGPVRLKFLCEIDSDRAYLEVVFWLSGHDGLTGALNERKYREEIEREFVRSSRFHRPLSLVIFSLDKSEELANKFGGLWCDLALVHIAEAMRLALAPEQLLARLEQNEFAIIIPEIHDSAVTALAMGLADEIASREFSYGELRLHLRCSFGVANRTDQIAGPEDLLETARAALAFSKLHV